jgi:hypothetical protein
MRRLAVCTVMFFLLVLSSGAAEGGRAITFMQVNLTILPWLRYSIVKEPSVLEVVGDLEQDYEDDRGHHEEGRDRHHGGEKDRSEQGERQDGMGRFARSRTLEIERGTVVSITTNTTEGYILSVLSLPSPVFTVVKVELKESGQSFSLGPGRSVAIHVPYSGRSRDTLELSYDFTLSPGVESGSYPWPIVVRVDPL